METEKNQAETNQTETKKKKRFHYAIWIFIGCCFTNVGFFALSANIVSVFIGQASAGVGAGPGDWAFNSTLGHITGIVTAPILGRWMQTGHFRPVAIFSLMCLVCKFYGFALATELWQVYVLGLLAGTGSTVLMTMLEPNLIGNWFAPKVRSKYLGFTETFVGVGTFCWAPLFAIIVNEFGYRIGYAACATLMFVICFPWVAFVFKFKPEDMGLQPYGYDPDDPNDENDNRELQRGTSAKKAFKNPVFWAMFIVMFLTSLRMGFNSYQTAFATEFLTPYGIDTKTCAIVGATMVSTAAVSNALGKIVFGGIYNYVGPRGSYLIFGALSICAFLTYIFFGFSIIALYIAAFLLGSYNCLQSVGNVLVLRQIFGHKDYAVIYSIMCVGTGFGGSIGNAIVGWFYQFTGTYFWALVYGLCTTTIALILALWSISKIGKIEWDLGPKDEDDTPAELPATA